MKPFVYAATLTSAIIFSIDTAQASNSPQTTGGSHSYLTSSAASPRNARSPFADYHFGLQVSGHPLSQLAIGIPQKISFTGVKITDPTNREVQSTSTVDNQTLLIHFMQPVAPNTPLKITLNRVKTHTLVGRIWSFPVSENETDGTTFIPIGIAQIHTYS